MAGCAPRRVGRGVSEFVNTTRRRRAPGLRHCAATYSSIACEKMVWRGCEVKRLLGFAASFLVATALAGCGAPPQGQSGASTSDPSGQQGGTAEQPRYNPASGDPNGCEPFVAELVEAQCAYAILEIEPRSLPALREETSPQRDAGAKRLLAILAAGRAASCGAVVEDGKFNGNLNAQIASSWSQPRPEACRDTESESLCRKRTDQYIPPPLNISNIRRMLEYCRTEAPSRARKQCSESSCMAVPVEAQEVSGSVPVVGSPAPSGEPPATGAAAESPTAPAPQATQTAQTESPPTTPSVIDRLDWARVPSREDFLRHYPDRASRLRLAGQATIECVVNRLGALDDCALVSETPKDAGFGQAALRLSKLYKMKPNTKDGYPTAGGTVKFTIEFNIS